jgi:hypothetical protein
VTASRTSSSDHRTAVLIACVGTLLVIAYAGLALAQILVLNPLAAAPGKTLDEIHADMALAGESLNTPMAVGVLSLGVGLAVLTLILLSRSRDTTPIAAALAYLLLLAFGAPAYFIAAFGAGMGLADTYLISGGDHSPWARALYLASALSFLGAATLGGVSITRSRRKSASPITT